VALAESGVSYRRQPCLLGAARGGSKEAGLAPSKMGWRNLGSV